MMKKQTRKFVICLLKVVCIGNPYKHPEGVFGGGEKFLIFFFKLFIFFEMTDGLGIGMEM